MRKILLCLLLAVALLCVGCSDDISDTDGTKSSKKPGSTQVQQDEFSEIIASIGADSVEVEIVEIYSHTGRAAIKAQVPDYTTLFSEAMARVRRCPVTGYLIIALLPLVPGGGIYEAMLHCVRGDTQMFLSALVRTMGIAGALALGTVLGSSTMRIAFPVFNRLHKGSGGPSHA